MPHSLTLLVQQCVAAVSGVASQTQRPGSILTSRLHNFPVTTHLPLDDPLSPERLIGNGKLRQLQMWLKELKGGVGVWGRAGADWDDLEKLP